MNAAVINIYVAGLAQSADVGVMNGQSVPELMNHCLCCAVDTAGGRTSVEYQIEEPQLWPFFTESFEPLFFAPSSWNYAWQILRHLQDTVREGENAAKIKHAALFMF